MAGKVYIAIDLKSFYASVECASRGFDPLTTNLVVADASRTEKTICLAVSPSLKAYGIPGRARLFEVIERVKQINAQRLRAAIRLGAVQKNPQDGRYHLNGSSFSAPALEADPALELTYYIAPPRMKLYEEVSTRVFSIYKKYISAEDIHVYSIDECFLDVTAYLNTYRLSPHELAMTMIREVLYETHITATAGIGTNLYLAKVAMDIVAKHVPPDRDGVRIAELDEKNYREKLWCHTPLTDFWRVGRGIARRMAALGCLTMGDIARQSVRDEGVLYKALGINAELLIDHAWGWEPTEIRTIKAYRPQSASLSSGQVLKEPYRCQDARLIVREMAELLALDLVRKGLVTRQLTLTLGYDRESLRVLTPGKTPAKTVYAVALTGKPYQGSVVADPFGRPLPAHAHGTENLEEYTSSARRITDAMMRLYTRIADPDLLIRRVNLGAGSLLEEDRVPPPAPQQLDFFTDYAALERQRFARQLADRKEHSIQSAMVRLQQRYGKNAVLKGMNLLEKGTTIERNSQIGGHRSGERQGDAHPNTKKEASGHGSPNP